MDPAHPSHSISSRASMRDGAVPDDRGLPTGASFVRVAAALDVASAVAFLCIKLTHHSASPRGLAFGICFFLAWIGLCIAYVRRAPGPLRLRRTFGLFGIVVLVAALLLDAPMPPGMGEWLPIGLPVLAVGTFASHRALVLAERARRALFESRRAGLRS